MFHALADFIESVLGIPPDVSGLILGIPALIFLIYYWSKKK